MPAIGDAQHILIDFITWIVFNEKYCTIYAWKFISYFLCHEYPSKSCSKIPLIYVSHPMWQITFHIHKWDAKLKLCVVKSSIFHSYIILTKQTCKFLSYAPLKWDNDSSPSIKFYESLNRWRTFCFSRRILPPCSLILNRNWFHIIIAASNKKRLNVFQLHVFQWIACSYM
jgi:hypothetical protein